jgi:mannosyltransferase OCH1-like enzyme
VITPATVHQIWVGPQMPAEYRRYLVSWSKQNPGWTYRLWGEADLAGLDMRNRALYDAAEVHAPTDAVRWRVDVARLEILWAHGGIYADCDSRCLKPLDQLRRHRMFFAQSPNDPRLATNAVMGAEAGHPFLDALIRGLPGNAAAYRGKRLVDSVGGKYITRMICTHQPPDVDVLPWWMFAGRSIRDRDRGRPPDLSRAYIDHLYGNTRGRRRVGSG